MSERTAHVTLKRLPRPLGDLGRTYQVVIDGSVVGGIRRRETKTFDVPAGEHRIQIQIDWCSSRELTLDLKPGAEANLICKARSPNLGWNVLRSSDYVELEAVDAVVVADSSTSKRWTAPPPKKVELPPGAPTDAEIEAAWDRWKSAADRARGLRQALQRAIDHCNQGEADRLKQEVQAALPEHDQLAAEYKRLKALRPDWTAPRQDA